MAYDPELLFSPSSRQTPQPIQIQSVVEKKCCLWVHLMWCTAVLPWPLYPPDSGSCILRQLLNFMKADRFQKLKQFVVGIRQDDKLRIWHRKALLVDYANHWILGSDHHFRLSKENRKTKEIHICQGKETLVKLWNWISVHTSLLIVEVSNKLFKIRKTGIVFINTAWNMQDRTVVRIIILYIPY